MNNICPYCGEDAGTTKLGRRQLSHPHHRPGTPFWEDWYRAMRDQGMRRTEVGDILLRHRERTREAVKSSLSKLHAWQRQRAAERGDDE